MEITAQAACERDLCSRALTNLQTLLYARRLAVKVEQGKSYFLLMHDPGRTIPKSWTLICPFCLHVACFCILQVLLCPVHQSLMPPDLLPLPHSLL